MIAKAIAHAPTRDGAMDALRRCAAHAEIWPVATNAAMLANLLDHPDRAGRRGDHQPGRGRHRRTCRSRTISEQADALILGAAGLSALPRYGADPWGVADGFRINAGSARHLPLRRRRRDAQAVKLSDDEHGVARASIGAESFEIDIDATPIPGGAIVSGAIEGGDVFGVVRELVAGPVLFTDGRAIALRRPEFAHALDGLAAGDDIRAPMPGKVLEVKAKAGRT